MTDGQIAFSRKQMVDLGLVHSGDALTQGIGVIDPQRVRDFYEKMVSAGLYKKGEIDPNAAFTVEFVNKGTRRD
jgi:NitT/TauT family transport system substrate-binding protein